MSEFDKIPKRKNALEDFLNIPPTEIDSPEYETKDIVVHDDYDSKDREIEEQTQEVFNKAMQGYTTLESLLSGIEPKYRARMAEVALDYLKTGLAATDSRAKQKESIEKQKISKDKIALNASTQSNDKVFFGDRNDFVKMVKDAMDENIIDVSPNEEQDK